MRLSLWAWSVWITAVASASLWLPPGVSLRSLVGHWTEGRKPGPGFHSPNNSLPWHCGLASDTSLKVTTPAWTFVKEFHLFFSGPDTDTHLIWSSGQLQTAVSVGFKVQFSDITYDFCQSISWSFPDGSVVKNPPANAGDASLSPGSGRSSGAGNTLQYSCLENSRDRGAWWDTVHGVTKSRTWMSNWACRSQYLCYLGWPALFNLPHLGDPKRTQIRVLSWQLTQACGIELTLTV